MKRFHLCLAVIFMTVFQGFAQKLTIADGAKKITLPIVYLPDNLSVHFISPEPIQYVDISSGNIAGDLPLKNILRIRYRTDSVKPAETKDAVITITGEKYIAQYHIIYTAVQSDSAIRTSINILPPDMKPLDLPGLSYSQPELKKIAMSLFATKPRKHLQAAKVYGISAGLNRVCALGDYIFLDIGFENRTDLKYDIDGLRFRITDKKIIKATNVQSIEILPDFVLFDINTFKKHYRNIFVFKKFSFPGNKYLQLEMNEKQLSGRVIMLSIPYSDILDADPVSL